MGNAVAIEKVFLIKKHAIVTVVDYHVQRQRNALEEVSFQEYHVETVSDGFQNFYSAVQVVNLSQQHVKFSEIDDYETDHSSNLPFRNGETQHLYREPDIWREQKLKSSGEILNSQTTEYFFGVATVTM